LEVLLSGVQEILLIILLILALVILPRIFSPKQPPAAAVSVRAERSLLSGKFRLAILISFLWLFGLSAVYAPWRGQWLAYFYAGCGPLIVVWGLYWVVSGFRSRRRH
jgi:hypothetical protein